LTVSSKLFAISSIFSFISLGFVGSSQSSSLLLESSLFKFNISSIAFEKAFSGVPIARSIISLTSRDALCLCL